MTYEYTIEITNKNNPNNNNSSNQTENAQKPSLLDSPKKEGGLSKKAKLMMVRQVKQYALWGLGSIGTMSGDSYLQTQVNNGIEAASLGVEMVTDPVSASLSMLFTMVKTMADEIFRIKKENITLSVSRHRNGYSSSEEIIATSRRH